MAMPEWKPTPPIDGLEFSRDNLLALLNVYTTQLTSYTEPFPSWLCLADLQNVDGLGELASAPGTAAELAENPPGLELGVRALAG
jgi:hypothetical protein